MPEAHEIVQLDTTKLAAINEEPQQQLFVLSFLSSLERLIDNFDADDASAYQLYVQKELLRIVQLTSPPPTRLIRTICGRCFAGVFGKGDRKLLFDTVNELLALINAGKDKDLRVKHAAAHCLGEVFGAAGDSAVSVATFAASSMMKLYKNSQSHCGLRSTIMRGLGKIFKMVGAMADESVSKDAWKLGRNAATDKSFVVQASALQVYNPSASFEKTLLIIETVFRGDDQKHAVLYDTGRLREAPDCRLQSFRYTLGDCPESSRLLPRLRSRTCILDRTSRTRQQTCEEDCQEDEEEFHAASG